MATTAVLAALLAPAAAPAGTGGGAAPVPAPVLDGATCRAACAGIARLAPGSVLRVTGDGMDGVSQVIFLGGRRSRDDVAAPATVVSPTAIDVAVPSGARSGKVRVITLEGVRSRASRSRVVVLRSARPERGPRVQARVDSRRVFVGSARKASVSYFVGGTQAAAVAVALVPRGTEQVVRSWAGGVIAPGGVGTIEWDGLIDGQPAPEGRYEFRVAATVESGTAQAAQSAPPVSRSAFVLLGHRFPIAGRHTYGEGAGRFGAARGGHTHEGQDVFAACGTRLVASIGGTVRHVATHERAGNYVVITGTDGFDHAYMHLQAPTSLRKGDPVSTGQDIGRVGDTGRASGCHLHYEMWAAPGWYSGGHAVDPLPYLKAWDR